jgi:NADPH:quinone reductase-like Zn-dependent oxidoreductase
MPKVARFHQAGGPEVLKVEEVEVGAPGAGEVRLRMEAIGLNRAEAMYRQGIYVDQPVFPSLIGYEGAGVIEALGEGVTGFDVGDRVSICSRPPSPSGSPAILPPPRRGSPRAWRSIPPTAWPITIWATS